MTSTPNCLSRLSGLRCKHVDLEDVPTDGREHELTLYMEDTMWPFADKFRSSTSTDAARCTPKAWTIPNPLLTIEAAFQPALGSHVRREVALMQRIHDPQALLKLLQNEIPPEHRGPGHLDARRS